MTYESSSESVVRDGGELEFADVGRGKEEPSRGGKAPRVVQEAEAEETVSEVR